MRRILTLALIALSLSLATRRSALAQCVDLPNGATAWWPLDESNGIAVDDAIANHNGLHVGNPMHDLGRVGNALRFDGDDYIGVPDSDLWAFGSADFTIELWSSFDEPNSGDTGHPGDILIGSDEGSGEQANPDPTFFRHCVDSD
jgi:hypothetical protein